MVTADLIAASVSAGSEGILYLPWLNGTLTPEENASVSGGFFNLSLSSTRSHMTRAVLEGIAFHNRWTLAPAEKFTGQSFDHLRFAGGGALSDVWAQIHADVLGRTIRQVEDPILANARGAAFLGAVALGHLRVDEIPDRVRIRKTFEPDPARHRTYEELFAEFRNLYKANRKIFARLNRDGSED